MNTVRRLVSCVLTGLAMGCSGTTTGNPSVPSGAEVVRSNAKRSEAIVLTPSASRGFGDSMQQFSFDLYSRLADSSSNLIVSPYSVLASLNMVYAGARGETEIEMGSALHYTLPQEDLHATFNGVDAALRSRETELLGEDSKGDGFQLDVVSQAWGARGYQFEASYLDLLAANYGAGLFLLDFERPEAARKSINDWVEGQTAGKIADLLPEGAVDANTNLVLTSAVYFKASWLTPFKAADTAPADFGAGAGSREVSTMHATFKARYAEAAGFRAVELSYLAANVRMLLVLPADGAAFLPEALTVEKLVSVREALRTHRVTIALPKWKFSTQEELKVPLQEMGMRQVFEAELADLSGIGGKRDLHLKQVYHSAFIAVDERGTEAAAATAAVVDRISDPPPVTIAFNRPFHFVIFDDPTGAILFLGHVVDPQH